MNGFRLISHSDLDGCGDGMQVLREGNALYVGHFGLSGMGTTVLDVSDPASPRVVEQWPAPPGTHTHKVQVADGLLLVNQERFRQAADWTAGLLVYDVSEPLAPKRIGRFDCGGAGVHRIVWTGGRYAHASATPAGSPDRIWLVLDLADPEHPVEAARFELDETAPAGERYAAHHALVDGDVAYLGYGDANLVVLDVSDWAHPRQIGRATWDGGDTHTCLPLPGRKLAVATDEQLVDGPDAPERRIRVLNIADPTEPIVVATCPAPEGRRGPLRYGPHNLHENQWGSWRSERFVFATYFNAGLVVYDLTEATAPRLAAQWLPGSLDSPQLNDLYVESGGRVWVTDRLAGGVYAVEPDDGLAGLLHDSGNYDRPIREE
jgi:hypothetical protein